MAQEKNHDYHILAPSIWPLIGGISAFVMLFGAVLLFKDVTNYVFYIGVLAVLYTMFSWWSDVVAEGEAGEHTPVILIGLRYGVILFIASEVMFFSAWFWSFFSHALFPMGPIEGVEVLAAPWPPAGIETFDPWHLPLINTLILLTSGCAATWAHHAVQENDRDGLKWGLLIATLLGLLFTVAQAYEYSHAAFGFSGNIYGANFFMATGFHGFHVAIGTIFLGVCYFRALKGHFTPERHMGMEAAIWYWHFVDVVWLFLFFVIYVWGS